MDVIEPAQASIGGRLPARVVAPDSESEVAEALAAARLQGEAVVPMGGGTALQVGDPPERYDLALSTARLTGVVEYAPADLTIVVRAGTTLAELDRELAEHGQFLPLDAPYPDRATVGGVLASRAGGMWRGAYASGRDMVIGMRVALPSGGIAKSGGRVVKNVAGYDLAKLFIGSFGTLGVIVEVAFKIYPRPAVMETLVMPAGSLRAGFDIAVGMSAAASGLLSVAVLSGPLGARLGLAGPAVVTVAGGTGRAAEEAVRALHARAQPVTVQASGQKDAESLLAAVRDVPGSATARCSALPGALRAAVAPWEDLEVLAYPLVGFAYVRAPEWTAEGLRLARQRVRASGGSVVILDRPAGLATVSAWGDVGPEIELMRRVKSTFDPQRVLSPGRFVGGL
jgi:glycolate oxidase FAD binding subunit